MFGFLKKLFRRAKPEPAEVWPVREMISEARHDGPMFLSFQGAAVEYDDDGRLSYLPRGEVVVNVGRIGAYYDHTLLIEGHKIRVMDTVSQIGLKILEAESE